MSRRTIEEEVKDNFEEFTVLALDRVQPKIEMAPYLRLVCDRYQGLRNGSRVIFNQPPRSGKSWVAKIYVAWYIGKRPTHEVLIVSATRELSEDIVDDIRKIISSDWYRQIFPKAAIAPNRSSVNRIKLIRGGTIRSTSVNSSIGGFGADLIILDDLNRIDDPLREGRLEAVNRKLDGEILSRLNKKKDGIVVITQHRLAENEASGHASQNPRFKVLAQPLIAPRRREYKLSTGEVWVRPKGDILVPGSYDKRDIKEIKNTLYPPFHWYYQQGKGKNRQKPFTYDCFVYNLRPVFKGPPVISVDTAQRNNVDGSYNVAQVWRRTVDGHHLVKQFRERCEFSKLESAVRQFLKYRPAAVLIENSAQGAALASRLRLLVPAAKLVLIEPIGSKAQRLERHRLAISRGIISVDPYWDGAYEFVNEFLEWPNEHTDQVDATVHYLDYIAKHPHLSQPRAEVLCAAGLYSTGVVITGGELRPAQNNNKPDDGIAVVLGSRRWRPW